MAAKGSHDHIIAANVAAGLCLNKLGEIVYPSGRVCKSGNGKARYRRVSLTHNGKTIGVTKARVLCWLHFGPPPTPAHEADHIDGNQLNDTRENLRWATRSENCANISPEALAARKAWMKNRHAEIKRKLATHAQLVEALEPFARLAETGFVGSIFEGAPDDKELLFHHASGVRVTIGDYRRAREALAAARGEA